MKALLLSKYRHLEIADVPTPTGSGRASDSGAAWGICGRDVHGYDGSSGRRIPPIVRVTFDSDAAVAFLAAESSRYVTGQTLLVDGGISTGATREFTQSAPSDLK